MLLVGRHGSRATETLLVDYRSGNEEQACDCALPRFPPETRLRREGGPDISRRSRGRTDRKALVCTANELLPMLYSLKETYHRAETNLPHHYQTPRLYSYELWCMKMGRHYSKRKAAFAIMTVLENQMLI